MGNDRQEPTDEELAREAQAGSLACFEQLVRRYEVRIFRFLYAGTGSREDAEDLAQKVFVKAFRNIGRFDPSYRFTTWLFTLARREAASFYRSRRPAAEPVAAEEADPRDPARILSDRESASALWDWARKRLKDKPYTALWLRVREEMSVKETASTMGLTSTHVKVLLHRARRDLAAAWADPSTAPRGMAMATRGYAAVGGAAHGGSTS